MQAVMSYISISNGVRVRCARFNGGTVDIDLPLSSEAFGEALRAYNQECKNIQDVLPELTADQREVLISGILPAEWDELFPKEQPTETDIS